VRIFSYLDVQEVADVKRYGATVHGRVVVHRAVVTDVSSHSECNGFRL